MSELRERPSDPLRRRAEAAKLMAALAHKGVRLQLRNTLVTWTAIDEPPTIAEQWQIHQLAATLRTILMERGQR